MTFLSEPCTFFHPIVTMGTFDGVHLGHQALLKKLRQRADETGGEAVVITYLHHPLETIHRKTFPYLLTPQKKKEALLKKWGADRVLYLNFTPQMAAMDAEDFFQNILIDELHTRELVVGYDTHFGKNRSGNIDFLRRACIQHNLPLDILPPLEINNRIVSSSFIRDLIREGAVNAVPQYLGRPYSLRGTVVDGHKIGRTLGFPTLNLSMQAPFSLIPDIGVYICEVEIQGHLHQALTNVGYSPTIKNTGIKEVETYILDFNAQVYGEEFELYFYKKLREELLFSSKDALISQIHADVKAAEEFFCERQK